MNEMDAHGEFILVRKVHVIVQIYNAVQHPGNPHEAQKFSSNTRIILH